MYIRTPIGERVVRRVLDHVEGRARLVYRGDPRTPSEPVVMAYTSREAFEGALRSLLHNELLCILLDAGMNVKGQAAKECQISRLLDTWG